MGPNIRKGRRVGGSWWCRGVGISLFFEGVKTLPEVYGFFELSSSKLTDVGHG